MSSNRVTKKKRLTTTTSLGGVSQIAANTRRPPTVDGSTPSALTKEPAFARRVTSIHANPTTAIIGASNVNSPTVSTRSSSTKQQQQAAAVTPKSILKKTHPVAQANNQPPSSPTKKTTKIIRRVIVRRKKKLQQDSSDSNTNTSSATSSSEDSSIENSSSTSSVPTTPSSVSTGSSDGSSNSMQISEDENGMIQPSRMPWTPPQQSVVPLTPNFQNNFNTLNLSHHSSAAQSPLRQHNHARSPNAGIHSPTDMLMQIADAALSDDLSRNYNRNHQQQLQRLPPQQQTVQTINGNNSTRRTVIHPYTREEIEIDDNGNYHNKTTTAGGRFNESTNRNRGNDDDDNEDNNNDTTRKRHKKSKNRNFYSMILGDRSSNIERGVEFYVSPLDNTITDKLFENKEHAGNASARQVLADVYGAAGSNSDSPTFWAHLINRTVFIATWDVDNERVNIFCGSGSIMPPNGNNDDSYVKLSPLASWGTFNFIDTKNTMEQISQIAFVMSSARRKRMNGRG